MQFRVKCEPYQEAPVGVQGPTCKCPRCGRRVKVFRHALTGTMMIANHLRMVFKNA